MKLFTRLAFSLLVGLAFFSSASATIVTVAVGDNWYVAPTGTHTTTLSATDTLLFSYATGFSSHPTATNTGAWVTFPMNANNRTKMFMPNAFQPGTYPYFCTAHGGQTGTLIVLRPAAAADARPAAAALTLYPNPSKGLITLQFTAKSGTDYKLRLSNVIGQEVRTVALKPELGEAGIALDLRDMPAGMYFYSLLVDGKAVSSKRLVLQN